MRFSPLIKVIDHVGKNKLQVIEALFPAGRLGENPGLVSTA
jgi:hypothetical protein